MAACSWGAASQDWAALVRGSAGQSSRAKSPLVGEAPSPDDDGRGERATDGGGGDGDRPGCARARGVTETQEVLEGEGEREI